MIGFKFMVILILFGVLGGLLASIARVYFEKGGMSPEKSYWFVAMPIIVTSSLVGVLVFRWWVQT